MINRLFTILGSEVNSFLSNWEKDLRFRKKEKFTTYKSSSKNKTASPKGKTKVNSSFTRKELQAFANLELIPTKDKQKIKKQFKNQVKKYHPDKHQDSEKKKIAETITKQLISSYELLYKK